MNLCPRSGVSAERRHLAERWESAAVFDSLQNWQLSRSAWGYVGRFRKQAEGGKPDRLKRLQGETTAELDGLSRSILSKAFKGEL